MHLSLSLAPIFLDDAIYAANADMAIKLLATGTVTYLSISEAWSRKHDPENSVACFLDQRVRNQEIPMLNWKVSGECSDVRRVLLALDEHCRQRRRVQPLPPEVQSHAIRCGLNLTDTFDRFVCHSDNRAAYGFAVLASLSAKAAQNPLLLFGPLGTGKSHLLNAIGLQYLSFANKAKVLRIEASAFSDSYWLDKNLVELEMLLVDGLEAVIGDPIAQDRLLAVAEQVAIRGSQVVFVSDADTKKLTELQENFLRLLTHGFCVDCS